MISIAIFVGVVSATHAAPNLTISRTSPTTISRQAADEKRVSDLRDEMHKTLDMFYDLPPASGPDYRLERINQAMIALAGRVSKAEGEATNLDTKARAGILRFEVASNAVVQPGMMLRIAQDIVGKYRDSVALCKPIEAYLFARGMSGIEYGQIDQTLQNSKNPEVVASLLLSRHLYKSMVQGELNIELAELAKAAPETLAGKRAAFIPKLRAALTVGGKMPDLQFDTYDGKRLKLSELKGKVVVLWFWGFWSGSSDNESKILESLSLLHYDKLAVIGINTDTLSKPRVIRMIKEATISFPNVLAGSPYAPMPIDFGISDYPATYVIDKTGIVRATSKDADVDKLIRALVK